MNTQKLLLIACSIVIAFFVLYPLLVLILSSFGISYFMSGGFTLAGYISVVTDTGIVSAMINSLAIAAGAALFAGIFGATLAIIVGRVNMPFRDKMENLLIVPIFLSPLLTSMAWIIMLAPEMGIINKWIREVFSFQFADIFSLPGIIFVMSMYYTPVMFLYCLNSLRSFDRSYEEASSMCGRGAFYTLTHITLHLILPAITSGATLIFLESFTVFSVPLMLGNPVGIYTVSTEIWLALSYYPPNRIGSAVLSIILMVFVLIGILVRSFLLGKRGFVTVSGRGFRQRLIDLGKWKYVALAVCVLFLLVSVLIPFAALLYTSLVPRVGYPKLEFTTKNYYFLFFQYPLFWRGIENGLLLASVGATATVILALVTSYVIVRTKLKGRSVLEFLTYIPNGIPTITFAVAILWAWIFIPLPIYGTIWILLIAYITVYSGYGVRTFTSTLRQIDVSLEEASRVHGVSWFRTFVKIVVPLQKLQILSAWTFIFIALIKDMVCSLLLSTIGHETLQFVLFDLWDDARLPEACALAVIQIVMIYGLITLIGKISGVRFEQEITKEVDKTWQKSK